MELNEDKIFKELFVNNIPDSDGYEEASARFKKRMEEVRVFWGLPAFTKLKVMHRPKQRVSTADSDNNLTAFVQLTDPVATNLLLLAITDEQRFIRVDKDNGRHFGIRGNNVTGLCHVKIPIVPARKYEYCKLVRFDNTKRTMSEWSRVTEMNTSCA